MGLDFLNLPQDIFPIIHVIQPHCCVAISNGFLKDHVGVAAYMLHSILDKIEIQGVLQTPGAVSTGNSYQCKLSGLIAIVYLSNILCSTYAIQNGSILVVRDIKIALKAFEP